MPSEAELAGRIGLAIRFSGLVGLEREMTGQTAGLRTHISVALGAALFAMVSAYGVQTFEGGAADTNVRIDVTRVASTIVTGVGFLGGGAILKYGANVRGLTTAGSLWVVAAIGVAVALGLYFLSTITTIALLISLAGLRAPRRWIRSNFRVGKRLVVLHLRGAGAVPEVVTAVHQLEGVEVRSLSIDRDDDETVIEADLRASSETVLEERLAELAVLEGVTEIDDGG